MAQSLAKFCGDDLDHSVEYSHPNIWQRETFDTFSRLIIGAREHEIPLILELCRGLPEPFFVLYVLVVSRLGREPGRYQSPEVGYEELELFLYTHQEFFEQDGRHHIWVASPDANAQFVFDNHNVIFAYGDLDSFEETLRERGFSEATVQTPSPHSHNYHGEFDMAEDDVMEYWRWQHHPLHPTDDP